MSSAKHEAGMALRRQVFGDELVDHMVRTTEPWRQPWQDYVVENLWAGIWGRPGLSLKMRSFITIAILSAQDRPHELKLHLLGAVRNGITAEEIAEVFLQTTMYAGLPAGAQAFRCAQEVLGDGADTDGLIKSHT
jgi:4-carboxymuconolactone decarboxylase